MNSHTLLLGMLCDATIMENSLAAQQIKQLLYEVGTDPKELKTSIQTKTCTQMFIIALLIIAKIWKQLTCLIADDWINKM